VEHVPFDVPFRFSAGIQQALSNQSGMFLIERIVKKLHVQKKKKKKKK
jgi:hypothetical protein